MLSPGAGSHVTGSIVWQAGFSGAAPSRVDLLIDGAVKWSGSSAPFAYGGQDGKLDTTVLGNGVHTLKAISYGPNGGKRASSSIRITVANAATSSVTGSDFTAAPVDFAHVALSWTPVPAAAAYTISRDGRPIAQTSGSSFADSMLWPSTTYAYRLTAQSATGTTLFAFDAAATTPALPSAGYPRPFPDASIWNVPVGNAQPVADSAALVSYLAANASLPNMTLRAWGVSVAEARPEHPTFSVPCTFYSACTLHAFGPFAIPLTAAPDPQGDAHLAVYDPAAHREWDMWRAQRTASGWTAGAGAAVSMDGNGTAPAGTAGGDAANLPLLGGLVRPEEILQGRIDHALVFAMPRVSRLGHICPATSHDGSSTDPNALKEGMRVQLDPAVNVDSLPIPAWEKTVARAMQTYGMYLRDQGGTLAVLAENPVSRGYDAWAKVGLTSGNSVYLGGIPWERFRVISAPC